MLKTYCNGFEIVKHAHMVFSHIVDLEIGGIIVGQKMQLSTPRDHSIG